MKTIMCLAVILLACAGIFAQEKTIDQNQFEAIYKNSEEMWKGKSYRLTVNSLSSVAGRPQTDYSSKAVFEFASPTTSRYIYESSFQSVNKKTEAIKIGDKTYTRNVDGKWLQSTFEANNQSPNQPTGAANQANGEIEYKYLGTENLNNQTAKVYAKIRKEKGADSSSSKEYLSTAVTKYWFAEDGKILKLDMQMESKKGEMTTNTRLIQSWESDPNIKIEAPTLN